MFATETVPRSGLPSPGMFVMVPGRTQGIGNALRSTFSAPKVDLPDDWQALLDRLA